MLDVKTLMTTPGASIPFEISLDCSTMEFGSTCPVTEPVTATGRIRNTAGVLELSGQVQTVLHAVCDRCAGTFLKPVQYALNAVLVPESEADSFDDLWAFEIKDGCADLEEIVNTAFVLNMESRFLCKEDCKGLCCRCGKNLNDGPCDCKSEPDPRFAALKQLLEKK